jgi:hypothetical protein
LDVACAVVSKKTVELEDEIVSTTSNVFEDIPGPGPDGLMAIDITTSPAPVGGGLLIDFSGVTRLFFAELEGNTNPRQGVIETTIAILIDDEVVAVASRTSLIEEEDDFDFSLDTLSITKLFFVAVPGLHRVKLQWRVIGDEGATVEARTLSVDEEFRYYMALRVVEVCSDVIPI